MVIEFNFWHAYEVLKPLTMYVFAIAFYGFIVFKFYRFLARKEMFELDLRKYDKKKFGFLGKILNIVLYVIEYIFIFPVFMFLWFLVLSFLLALLSKTHTADTIMLISIALVGAVRIVAYYHEDLSQDLGKLIPYALLGVFLADMVSVDFSIPFNIIKNMFLLWNKMIYYLVFIIVLEFVLRISNLILSPFLPEREDKDKEKKK